MTKRVPRVYNEKRNLRCAQIRYTIENLSWLFHFMTYPQCVRAPIYSHSFQHCKFYSKMLFWMKVTLILPSSLLDFHQIGYSVPLCSVFIFSLSVFNKPPGFVNCPCSVILEDFWPFNFHVHFFLVLFLFPLWTSAYARPSSMTFPTSLWGFVFSSVMFPLCFLDHNYTSFIYSYLIYRKT